MANQRASKKDDSQQHSASTSANQLKEDLQQLSQTLEELLSATSSEVGSGVSDNVKAWRSKAEDSLKQAKARLNDMEGHIKERGERAYRQTRDSVAHQVDACDHYVHENPWKAVGVGAAVGVIVGLLIGRR